jgi:hypothetical protein
VTRLRSSQSQTLAGMSGCTYSVHMKAPYHPGTLGCLQHLQQSAAPSTKRGPNFGTAISSVNMYAVVCMHTTW